MDFSHSAKVDMWIVVQAGSIKVHASGCGEVTLFPTPAKFITIIDGERTEEDIVLTEANYVKAKKKTATRR